MSLSAEDLQRVIRTAWSTQLQLELEAGDVGELSAGLERDDSVVVKVYFVGDFNGSIEQRCSPQVSLRAAAAAFAGSGKDLETSDIRDTALEMAHMTAGNLKSFLPGTCRVLNVEPEAPAPLLSNLVAEAGFTLDGEPLIVRLMRTG